MEKNEKLKIAEYFADVELIENYEPYFCSIGDAITIVIVGTFCGFRNLMQIHQWAKHEKIKPLLSEYFGVSHVPCYYWLTRLMKIIEPKSMNECFIEWVSTFLPENMEGKTISFDGKTICSTGKMDCYENPLHIVSAQISELGLTFGQEAVEGKSNEIPAVQRLIKMLQLKDCVIVADALNCQKATATAIVEQKANYILSVKDNQAVLKKNIEDYIQDQELQKRMKKAVNKEKSRGRIEKRTAYVTTEIEWLEHKDAWVNLCCIGAIHTSFTTKSGVSNEWHYYISSKPLTAEELLQHVRGEWSVESMHWLLDVHFREDDCRIQDENSQRVLNMIRKIVINSLRVYKQKNSSKKAFSNLMMNCLIDPLFILDILNSQN